MTVILCLRRLETRNWDRKLIRRLFTEVIISGEENVNRRHWLHVLDQRSLSMFIQSMVQCKHLLLSCMTCCSCRLAFNTRFCSLFSNPMFSGSKLWASDTDTGLSRHCFTEILADFLHCHSSRKWGKKVASPWIKLRGENENVALWCTFLVHKSSCTWKCSMDVSIPTARLPNVNYSIKYSCCAILWVFFFHKENRGAPCSSLNFAQRIVSFSSFSHISNSLFLISLSLSPSHPVKSTIAPFFTMQIHVW